MTTTHWSPQVTRAMLEFADAAPLPPLLDGDHGSGEPRRGRPPMLVLATAVLILVGAGGTVAALLIKDPRTSPATVPSSAPETTVAAKPSMFDSGASMIVWVYWQATPDQIELLRNAILASGAVTPDELLYLDHAASLAKAERVFADDPEALALLKPQLSTAFELFPADPAFDAERWRTQFAALPMVVDVRTPADEAATPTDSERAPTGTGPETTEVQATDGICEPGANTAEIGSTPISDLSFSVVKSEDGSFGLTAELPEGTRASLGCMRADTDGAIEAMRLSMAAVRPVQDGVLVVLAVPTGSTPRWMDWLTFAPGQVSKSTPFTVYVGLFPFGNEAVPSTTSTASEQQLVGFVNEALRSGTSSTGGIGADILSDP